MPAERGHAERRIINGIVAAAGLTISPSIVSNSFLGVCAHLRGGKWCSIVPHTFFYIFGGEQGLVSIDLVEPRQSQSIGLVLPDRNPQSPMVGALLQAIETADFEARFREVLPAG